MNNYKEMDGSWSPDSSQIIFESNRDGDWDIYIMNADGSNVHQLTFNESADEAPVFSPDGKLIAFESNIDGDWELYLMDINGKQISKLTDNQYTDWWPSWLPTCFNSMK